MIKIEGSGAGIHFRNAEFLSGSLCHAQRDVNDQMFILPPFRSSNTAARNTRRSRHSVMALMIAKKSANFLE